MIASLFNTWYGVVSAVIVGGVAVYGIYKSTTDRASDRLINILKTTVDEMEGKIVTMQETQKQLTVDIENLKTTNKTLVDILQGRDGQSVEMYKMIDSTHRNVEKLYALLEKHFQTLETKV